MKKSRADDGLNNPDEQPQRLLKSNEAIKNSVTWIKWLTMTYPSYFFENGVKYKGPILDHCPACDGRGFIGGKDGDGYSCPICLTGKYKNNEKGTPFYKDKPICEFISNCPIKDKSQKQEKCHKCICKFDSSLK